MSHPYGKECVPNPKMIVSTELQQALPIPVAFSSIKMTLAVGSRASVIAHFWIEVTKENQCFSLRDMLGSFINLAVEGILSIRARSQGWSIDRKQLSIQLFC